MKAYAVYIMSNINRTVFYIGVTGNLSKRINEHKESVGAVFTAKYKCFYLVYYEFFTEISQAIKREKQLKNWHKEWKVNLIHSMNPQMNDLTEDIGYL
jgi:putative endonuclease